MNGYLHDLVVFEPPSLIVETYKEFILPAFLLVETYKEFMFIYLENFLDTLYFY